MDFSKLAKKMGEVETNGGGSSYVKSNDVCKVLLEEVTTETGTNWQGAPRQHVNVTFRLLTSATTNKPKSEDHEGDVLKSRFTLPADDGSMSEGEFNAKASILKSLLAAVDHDIAKMTSLEQIGTSLKGKQMKIVIRMEESISYDQNTKEPTIKEFARYFYCAGLNEELGADALAKSSVVKKLSDKQTQTFAQKRAEWEKATGNVPSQAAQGAMQQAPPPMMSDAPQTGVDDDFNL